MEIPAEFGPIVMGHSHLDGSTRKGRKPREKAVLEIRKVFNTMMDNEAKSCLLDAVIKEIAGPEEFDKCRLGCAMVESLKRFEEKLESDLSEEAMRAEMTSRDEEISALNLENCLSKIRLDNVSFKLCMQAAYPDPNGP